VNHDNNQVRTIDILGAALPTSMSISPDGTVDLGPACLDTQTGVREFAIVKNNQGTFRVTSVSNPPSPFVLADAPVNTLVDDQIVTFSATATPTVPGTVLGQFDVTTDIPGEAPHPIMLKVTGLSTGVAATPTFVDFGVNLFETTSIPQSVALTNCSGGPLTLAEPSLTGDAAGDFQITMGNAGTLGARESITYQLVMTPTANGTRGATLVIDHEGGPSSIRLVGDGTGVPDIDSSTPRNTYYSCSVGGRGGGLVVLALVMVIAPWRRRRRESLATWRR
jgi:MYXO-CTERM domain-containing protein